MSYKYKIAPLTLKKSQLLSKKSLSSKDYSMLYKSQNSKLLKDLVIPQIGDAFSSKDFLTEDLCKKYRYIKTGNLTKERLTIDFTTTEYCKPIGSDYLADGDILIAKDGGTGGLGEACIYQTDNEFVKDYICAEILRLRVNEPYDRWYILAALKSQHFKDYMDIVTPEGTSFRHSKLLSLNYDVPFPKGDDTNTIKYVSLLTQNLIDKENQMHLKKRTIDSLIYEEVYSNCNKGNLKHYSLPKVKLLRRTKRLDTGIYTDKFFKLNDIICNYKGGCFYLNNDQVKPGETPNDYKFSDTKQKDNFLWVTPSNIETLELLYETYVKTSKTTRTRDYSVILSGIRHLGYGYFVDKGQKVYCNQNTLVINYSNKIDEQIFLLAYFTSSIGKKLQFAWRVDGLVPIIYSEDFAKIPVPKFGNNIKNEIVSLYYSEVQKSVYYDVNNYIAEEKLRNKKLGIYQLNKEVLKIRRQIDRIIDNIIKQKPITIDYNIVY